MSYDYDRKTASGKSYADFQRSADLAFWEEVSKRLKVNRGVQVRVVNGTSVAFLTFDGVDSSDLSIEGHASLILLDSFTVKLVVSFTSAYSGKGEREQTFKSGVLNVDVATRMIGEVIGV